MLLYNLATLGLPSSLLRNYLIFRRLYNFILLLLLGFFDLGHYAMSSPKDLNPFSNTFVSKECLIRGHYPDI